MLNVTDETANFRSRDFLSAATFPNISTEFLDLISIGIVIVFISCNKFLLTHLDFDVHSIQATSMVTYCIEKTIFNSFDLI